MPWKSPSFTGTLYGHSLAVIHTRTGQALLAVGAPQTGDGGTVYIYSPVTSQTSQPPVLQMLVSPKSAAMFGSALAAVDVNNDGTDDLIVGAPMADETVTGQGLVYVFRSQPDGGFVLGAFSQTTTAMAGQHVGTALAVLRPDGGAPSVAALAPGAYSVFVFNTAGAQTAQVQASALTTATSLVAFDWSGDGRPDLLAGLSGEVIAFRAEADAGFSTPTLNNPLTGVAGFGAAMAPVGDSNQNGREDVIITAPTAPMGAGSSGEAFLLDGTDFGGPMPAMTLLPLPQAAMHFGDAVADIGPFQGTGSTIVVGAPQTGMGGTVYFYSLVPGQAPMLYDQFPSTMATGLGNAIVGNADFDEDGQFDLAVGAETNSGGGAVQLIFGTATVMCTSNCGPCSICVAGHCVATPGSPCMSTDPCMTGTGCGIDGGCMVGPKCPAFCDSGRDAGCYGATEFHIIGDANLSAVVNQPYQYNMTNTVRLNPTNVGATFASCFTVPGFVVDSTTGVVTWFPQTAGPTPVCIRATQTATGAGDAYLFIVDVASASDFTVLPSNVGTVPFQVTTQANDPVNMSGWTWDFGDMSSTMDGDNSSHTYLMPGTYWVELRAITPMGMLRSRQPVYVKDTAGDLPPKVKLESSAPGAFACPTCDGRVSYLWDFGDPMQPQSTQSSVQLALTMGEQERVRLTVTDPDTGLKGFDYAWMASPGATGLVPPDCRLSVDPPVGNVPFTPLWSFNGGTGGNGTSSWNEPPGPYPDAGEYRGYATSKDAANGTVCLDVAWATALAEYGVPAKITSAPPLTANCGDTYRYAWSATGTQPITYQLQGPPGALRVGDSVTWVVPPQPGVYAFELVALNPVKLDVQDFPVTVTCDGGLPPVIDAGPPPIPPPAEYNFSACGCQASGGLQLLGLAMALLLRRLSRR
jgi:hypothetical protein